MPQVNSYGNSVPVVATSRFFGTDALGETVNYEATDVAAYCLGYSPTTTTQTGSITINQRDYNTFMRYGTTGGTILTPLG